MKVMVSETGSIGRSVSWMVGWSVIICFVEVSWLEFEIVRGAEQESDEEDSQDHGELACV